MVCRVSLRSRRVNFARRLRLDSVVAVVDPAVRFIARGLTWLMRVGDGIGKQFNDIGRQLSHRGPSKVPVGVAHLPVVLEPGAAEDDGVGADDAADRDDVRMEAEGAVPVAGVRASRALVHFCRVAPNGVRRRWFLWNAGPGP